MSNLKKAIINYSKQNKQSKTVLNRALQLADEITAKHDGDIIEFYLIEENTLALMKFLNVTSYNERNLTDYNAFALIDSASLHYKQSKNYQY